jgi:hypothetical protein
MTIPGQFPRRMSRGAVTVAGRMSRDRVAVLSGLVAPLALAVILVPFRSRLRRLSFTRLLTASAQVTLVPG